MKIIHLKNKSLFLLCSFITLFNRVNAQENQSEAAIRWKPWEHTINFSGQFTGERPLEVAVIFDGPTGESFPGAAFTDDGRHYTIRAMFPEVGAWRWRTKSSERGLDNIRGRVEVVRYIGDNPLYHHGDIRVSTDKRYLVHADGTPFLWIGDTGWNATYNSTIEEWKTYVDTRSAQRFSVIQVSPRGVGNRNTASAKPTVAFRPDGTNDPGFWKDLEDKIHYANEKGILIMLTGVGNAWRDTMEENPSNQRFESYLAGRMASLIVIFSPSFDQLFADELDKVATELQKWTTHIVTQHPGTNHDANLTFRNTTAVDFSGLQSGHHGGDLTKAYAAARQWTLDLWGGAPVKPVILLEAMYDAYGHNNSKNWREKDSRKPGWIAWMSGARGFTYGAGDIPPKVPGGHGAVWMFNKDSSTYDFWQKSVQWESAWQITSMRVFIESVPWWQLNPTPELIRNQAMSDTLHMSATATHDLNLIIVYMPDNPRVILDMTLYIGTFNATWFDPRSGRYIQAVRINGGDPNEVFERPEGWDDAVLKITRL